MKSNPTNPSCRKAALEKAGRRWNTMKRSVLGAGNFCGNSISKKAVSYPFVTVLAVLCILSLSLMFTNTAYAAANVTVGSAELLYTDSQMPFTMDASFATLKKDSNTMEFFEEDMATSSNPLRYYGPLSAPLQTQDSSAVFDFNGYYHNFPSGLWLPNIYDDGSGTLIGLCHREDYSGGGGFFAIGLAKSTDGGANWKYLGDVLRPYANNSTTYDYSNIGGVPYLIVGNYMYVYFNEHTTGTSTGYKRLAVARALVSDVMNAAANNTVPTFSKYAGGAWTQNGLTGLADNIIPNGESLESSHDTSRDFHSDAAYCTPLGKYLITVQTHSQGQLLLFTSTDGISWGEETVIDSASGVMQPYSCFASLDADASSDCHVVGSTFYIIYPEKVWGSYSNDTLYRRKITIGTGTTSGWYCIKNRTSGLVIDDSGGSTSAGTTMAQWAKVNSPNLNWQLVSSDSGYYYIQNQTSGLYLDGFGYTTNGAPVKQWGNSGSYNQQWQPVAADSGYYYLKNRATSLYLDGGGATANGAVLKQWGYANSANLQWSLQPVDGTYKVVSQNSGLSLEAPNQWTGNGQQIDQWSYYGGSSQQWTLTDTGNGNYKFIGVQSGRALDIAGGNSGNGTKVQLYDSNGATAQRYKLTSSEVGQFRITPNCATGSCLDVYGASTANGGIVNLWQWNGGANQKWSFQKP